MKWLGLRARLRALTSTVMPSLRVIGMAYAGLIGVGATALVISVAFLPVSPVLQEATQPAREAVANLVQPATDVVTSLISSPPAPHEPRFGFMPAPPVAVASSPTIEDTPPEEATPPRDDVRPVAASSVAPRVIRAPAPVAKVAVSRAASVETADPIAEDVPADAPDQAVDARDRAPVVAIAAAPVDSPVQQEANAEAPRPLPALPTPTEAAWQAKARLDAENQTAIDTAKASLVRRKAEADTANQAAIAAARAPRPPVKVTVIPTPQPAPAVPTPTPTPTAAPTPTPVVKAADPVSIDALSDQPMDEEEMPITLALDKSSDVSR